MAFPPHAIALFREMDNNGSGAIKRTEMLQAIASFGYGQISQTLMLSMLQLFETRTDGQVNYGNMLEYVREAGVGIIAEEAAARVYEMVAGGPQREVNDQGIRDCFKAIDTSGSGYFNIQQLSTFLDAHGVHAPKEAIVAMYAAMDQDTDSVGIRLHGFALWLRAVPAAGQAFEALYSNLTSTEIQRKAHTYLVAVAATPDASLDELTQSYAVYDFRQPPQGAIDKTLFMHATARAGFPFTHSELRALAAEFGVGGKVSYRKCVQYVMTIFSHLLPFV